MNDTQATTQAADKSGVELGSGGPEMIKNFCDNGFGSDIDATALAVGRDAEELRSMLDGETEIDEDLEMKMRGIAQERGFDV